MIEISTWVGGKRWDTAEADTPEAATAAARQLILDAEATGVQTQRLTTRYFVDGLMVREVYGGVAE